jgi:hypothetical protein
VQPRYKTQNKNRINHKKYTFSTVTIFVPRTNRGFGGYTWLNVFFSSTIPTSGFFMPCFFLGDQFIEEPGCGWQWHAVKPERTWPIFNIPQHFAQQFLYHQLSPEE